MPANERALRATNAYRTHISALHRRAQTVARRGWQVMGPDLDATHALFVQRTAPALTELQRAGARLSAAYLATYTAVSLGHRPTPTGRSLDQAAIGQSRAGKPLDEALLAPLIATKRAISDGHALDAALALAAHQLVRNAGEDVMYAARGALFDAISTDQRIVGWRRVTGGGCGACMALADGAILPDDSSIEVHDGCQCTAEPVVADVPDRVARPTGREMFTALTVTQQDELLGPDKAQLVRDGDVPFHALVDKSPMKAIPDQITETPLEALAHH